MFLKNKNFIDFSYVFLSSSFGQALRVIRNLFVAGMLGPEIFGTIQGLSIFLLYIPILQLGYFQAANREIPQLIGRNDVERVKKVEYNGILVSGVSSFIALMIYCGIFFYLFDTLTTVTKICWAGFALTVLMQPLGQFYQVIYSANGLFQMMSRIKVMDSIVFFAMLILVFFFGYVGQLISLAVSAVLILLLMYRSKKVDLSINRTDSDMIIDLVRKGYPILLSALAFNVFFTIDRIFIIGVKGAEEYGYYSIGASFFQIVLFVPESIRQISYRMFNIEYGKGEQASNLKRGFWLSFFIVCITMWTISVVSYIILPSVIAFFLPAYLSSIIIVKIFTLTMGFAAPGLLLSSALFSVHHEKTVLKIYLLAIILFVMGGTYFLHRDLPTYFVAILISIAHTVSSIGMFMHVAKLPEYRLSGPVYRRAVQLLTGLIIASLLFTVVSDALVAVWSFGLVFVITGAYFLLMVGVGLSMYRHNRMNPQYFETM